MSKKLIGKKGKTSRGFEIVEFKDLYDSSCSLQQSSLATDNAVWLGIDNPSPKVMACEAHLVGVKTNETCGWVPYPIPEEVLLSTRMHLNEEQVKQLINRLNKWLETGSF